MARKHGSKPKGQKSRPRGFNPKEGKIQRWENLSDIPLDEEENFHASRDRILLNGEDDDYLDEGDEDEVFALKGLAEDNSESEVADEEGSDEGSEGSEDLEDAPSKTTPKFKSKGKKSKPSPPSSQASESEEEEEVWGKKKSDYYSSNAAQLESDDEEANEMEEQEAKRLQSKARESMVEDDFGLGDAVEDAVEPEDDLMEAPPVVVESLPKDKDALLRHIEKTNPEALALARDWDDIARSLVKSQAKIATYVRTVHSPSSFSELSISLQAQEPDTLSLGMLHLHYQALLTYATTLAFYLHLRASEKYASRPDLLQKHPIMSRLLTLKQSLITLEELDFAPSDSDDDLDEDADAFDLWTKDKIHGLEWDELRELLADADDVLGDSDPPKTRSKGKVSTEPEPKLTIKIKGKGKAKATDEEVQVEEPPKKKRKKSKVKSDSTTEPVLPVFDLVEPTFPSSSSSSKSKASQNPSSSSSLSYDPYGEHLTLQQADAQDKASRKRSLRFHTSKIESSSAKRERARQGMGGDDDIPWKERKKAKEDRLAKEAAKKRGMRGDDLDDTEPEPREDGSEGPKKKRKRAEEDGSGESDGEGDGDGGYYELVKKKSKEKKEQKKAEYDAVQAAIKSQFDEDETADGPRSLTRAILKNKGLTPHRSKSIRNPRVKKRQRFEKAKKKVSSQKAVYKGGVSATGGRYDGEKSGISKVIKSTPL